MGNQCNNCVHQTPNELLSTGESNEKFFIHYVRNKHAQSDDEPQVQTIMDQRRLIFVSFEGLVKSWQQVPCVLLYSALCLMPLKRKWIMNPAKYMEQFESVMSSSASLSGQIMDLLKWKDSQGLVLWALDYFDEDGRPVELKNVSPVSSLLIGSFWIALSDKLTHLYDHITDSCYKPIHLDKKWWTNKDKYFSKYGVTSSSILSELYFVNWKYNVIKEIMYQSNPRSLRVITEYRNASNNKCFIPLNESPLSIIKEINENKFTFNYCIE